MKIFYTVYSVSFLFVMCILHSLHSFVNIKICVKCVFYTVYTVGHSDHHKPLVVTRKSLFMGVYTILKDKNTPFTHFTRKKLFLMFSLNAMCAKKSTVNRLSTALHSNRNCYCSGWLIINSPVTGL